MQIRWQDNAIDDSIRVRRFIAIDNPAAAAPCRTLLANLHWADRDAYLAHVNWYWLMSPASLAITRKEKQS